MSKHVDGELDSDSSECAFESKETSEWEGGVSLLRVRNHGLELGPEDGVARVDDDKVVRARVRRFREHNPPRNAVVIVVPLLVEADVHWHVCPV